MDLYTVIELRHIARDKGLSGYSSMKKEELISLIKKPCKKIAFCFLLYDKIDHNDIWVDFFSQDKYDTHTIYSHVKKVTKDTPTWIRKNMVSTVPTAWCSETITIAFNQMLIQALKNKNNTHFCFLSGSDIPLYKYKDTYRKIMSTSKSRIYYMRILDNVFKDRKDIYNAHNWVILNRKNAYDYIRLSKEKTDTRVSKFLNKFRELYKKNGVTIVENKDAIVDAHASNTWIGSCMDETYPINWLVELYGGTHTSQQFRQQIKFSQPTYSYWDFDKDPLHPKIFDIKSVKKYKNDICNGDSIFARKFSGEAANWISMKC
jgi:hypothetical protein